MWVWSDSWLPHPRIGSLAPGSQVLTVMRQVGQSWDQVGGLQSEAPMHGGLIYLFLSTLLLDTCQSYGKHSTRKGNKWLSALHTTFSILWFSSNLCSHSRLVPVPVSPGISRLCLLMPSVLWASKRAWELWDAMWAPHISLTGQLQGVRLHGLSGSFALHREEGTSLQWGFHSPFISCIYA